ncbi:MAG: T9SS type A sorting domain-containing protein [Bacteroidota bacterium]
MKTIRPFFYACSIFLFLGASVTTYAQSHRDSKALFNHLATVNKEWLKHADACPQETTSFTSDVDRIQRHLNLVIEHLRLNSPVHLTAEQLNNRLELLAGLQAYANQKVFPINTYHPTRQPYFVDDLGTHCAVGQMMALSGNQALVAAIQKEHNYDYLEDIQTVGVQAWAQEFGFTMEELEWIQPGYAPAETIVQVQNGTNGSVTMIEEHIIDGSLTIAGDFTELDNLPCLNIGVFKNGQLNCLGAGLDGIIHDVIHLSGDIYVFGELYHNGAVFPVAKYTGSSWDYINVPDREGAICTAAVVGGSIYNYVMVISHNSLPGQQEIWYNINNLNWEKGAEVNGTVLDITPSSYGRVFVGHFDMVVAYHANGSTTTLAVNNVLFGPTSANTWTGITDDISDTVYVVENFGDALFFGGTCSNQPGASNICISRYFNGVLQPLLVKDFGAEQYTVTAIAYDFGAEFVFGGDFELIPAIGTYGNNLATYHLGYNSFKAIASFDQPVNSLAYLDGELLIGGDFQMNLDDNINFLARLDDPVSTSEYAFEDSIDVYPNPFISSLQVAGVENGTPYSMLTIDGRLLRQGQIANETIENLEDLPSGVFLLQLETPKGTVIKKVIK